MTYFGKRHIKRANALSTLCIDVVVGIARYHVVKHFSSLSDRSRVHAPGSYRPHPLSIFLFIVGYRDCRTLCCIFFQCKHSLTCRTMHQDFVEIDLASLSMA